MALSVDLHLPGVTWHLALGARTFLHPQRDSDCLGWLSCKNSVFSPFVPRNYLLILNDVGRALVPALELFPCHTPSPPPKTWRRGDFGHDFLIKSAKSYISFFRCPVNFAVISTAFFSGNSSNNKANISCAGTLDVGSRIPSTITTISPRC